VPGVRLIAYPRVSPAMMVLVIRGREMLLARCAALSRRMYSALAGFVEPGETIEDCVRREVREEVGIEVDGIAYFASQSWAFPHSLMIAFTAHYAGGELTPDPAGDRRCPLVRRSTRCRPAVADLDRPPADRRHGRAPRARAGGIGALELPAPR
jgi:ADP-ribose pyrophosphatase YjhB (NUDIX family)